MRLSSLIIIYLLFSLLPAFADELKQIYQAEVNVDSRSVDDRNAAIRDAMKMVLSRITMGVEPNSQGSITKLLNNASRFTQTYQYKSTSASEDGVIRRLRVNFDGDSIRRILQADGIAVWGVNRPSILIWLAVEQNGVRRLFQPEHMLTLNQSLLKAANDKGLSLILPLLDLVDQDSLSTGDLWAGFDDRIIQASNRYDANIILTGRLVQKTGKSWDSHWRMYSSDNIVTWGMDGNQDLDTALQDGFDGTYARLFPVYATRGIKHVEDGIRLRVTGLTNLTHFARVAQYLAGLNQADKVHWSKLEPSSVTFVLQPKNNLNELKQALAGSLVIANDFLAEQQSDLLQYRLQP